VAVAAVASVVASIYEDAAKRRAKDVIQSCSKSCHRHHSVLVVVFTRSTILNRRNVSYAPAYHQILTSVSSAAAISNCPSAAVRISTSNTTPTPAAYWVQSATVSATATLIFTKRLDLG